VSTAKVCLECPHTPYDIQLSVRYDICLTWGLGLYTFTGVISPIPWSIGWLTTRPIVSEPKRTTDPSSIFDDPAT
jgi:hypothetical protein